MSFGRRLAQSRKRVRLTQVQLAVALGDRYDHTMISHVEAGRSALLFDGATKAARELGVSLDYLAGLTDTPEPAATLAAKVSVLDDASAVTTDEADGHSVDVMELDTAARRRSRRRLRARQGPDQVSPVLAPQARPRRPAVQGDRRQG